MRRWMTDEIGEQIRLRARRFYILKHTLFTPFTGGETSLILDLAPINTSTFLTASTSRLILSELLIAERIGWNSVRSRLLHHLLLDRLFNESGLETLG